jgi:Major Facilitator Superfamily
MQPKNRVISAVSLSNFADGLLVAALPMYLVSNNYPPSAISLVLMSRPISMTFSGIVLAKLINRRAAILNMLAAQVVRIGALGAATYSLCCYAPHPYVLIALFCVLGCMEILHDSSSQGLTAGLLRPEELSETNAKIQSYQSIGNDIAGPVIGAYLLTVLQGLSFGIPIVLYVLSLLLLRPIRPHNPGAPQARQKASYRDILAAIWMDGKILRLFLAGVVISLSGGLFAVAYPYHLMKHLGVEETTYGLTLACFGMGALVNGTRLQQWARHLTMERILLLSAILLAVSSMIIVISASLPLLLVAQFVGGYALIAWISAEITYRQHRIAPSWLMPVTSLCKAVEGGAFLLGIALAGALVGPYGAVHVLMGVCAIQVSAIIVLSFGTHGENCHA